MKILFPIRYAAVLMGVQAKDFAVGWANGLARWRGRWNKSPVVGPPFEIPRNEFERGSVRWAASEAAVKFMQEKRVER